MMILTYFTPAAVDYLFNENVLANFYVVIK